MPVFFLLLFLLAAVSSVRATPVTLGPETSLPLPSSALYHSELGYQPDDGSVQNLNPPVFTWLYYESPALYVDRSFLGMRRFRLQLSPAPDFSTLTWDVACSNNFYNFLAPITNSDGSMYTGPNYWRVLYLSNTGTVISNSATFSFTLAANAKPWNRSMFADDNYLLNISSTHPHIFFWPTNRDAVSKFLQTSTWEYPGTYWTSVTNDAFTYINSTWWNNLQQFTNFSRWPQFANAFAEVAFTYQMTTNAAIAAADPGRMLEIYATNLLAGGYDKQDGYQAGDIPQYLAECYDWLYPIMTPQQRSNVLYFMECEAQDFVYQSWLYTGTSKVTNHIYTNMPMVGFGSEFREGESHSRNGQIGLALCLSGMGDSPTLRGLLPYFLNYYIAQFDPFQGDDGRLYNSVQNFQLSRQGGSLLLAAASLPDLQLANAPILTSLLKEFAYYQPVGYGGTSEIEPFCWGVQGIGPVNFASDLQYTRYYDIACLLQSGPAMRQYQRQKAFNVGGHATGEEVLFEVFSPYYWKPPVQTEWPDTYFLDIVRGWAISGSHPPSDYSSFTNGVGFIFQARPSAAGRLNATFTDGQVEMWAYGAHVTTGGSGNYEEHSMFQNNSLMVDGIGYNNPNPAVSDPWYARYTAFTNTRDYTWVSADLTKAFARTNWLSPGYQNVQANFYAQATNARPYISSVTRSVLFPHKRYFVLYDQMQTTQPAFFQWKWNVWRPTVTVNPTNCSFSYICTNGYNGSNVTVYVAHIVDPTQMTITNLSSGGNLLGTNPLNMAKINPITGENYNLPGVDYYYPDQYWPYWANTIWVQNKTAATSWHFMTVIFPVKWGQPAPTITRVDDNTVQVQQGTDNDTISFTPGTPTPTVSIDLNGPSLGPVVITPPQGVRVGP